jgi:multidrug efflux pump
MFSSFFINRPIFASVLSIFIVLAGGIALFTLPVAQYPDIAPPTVEVSASYPGANAEVVADTVAAPIEQQVNGVEGMIYMSSQCTNDGNYTLTVTFRNGVDLNISQVLVQNRESLAEPILPDLVKRRGISVKKKSPNVLMIVNLESTDERKGDLELSNYATIQIRDELSRVPGVGDITYLGQRDYSMRIWLDPPKLASYGLNAADVIAAVQTQNNQVAAGQIGQPPTPRGQVTQYIITTLGRLSTKEQFEEIILKNDGNTLVYLRDVAKIELGAQSYDQSCTLDGKPSMALSVYQLPGSNALDVARRIKERMVELSKQFPPGIGYKIVYDTTPFINESVKEVFETLFDAIVLVAVVVLVFLQNWRSTLIPLIAVPVAIIGTFAVMAAMGFSLNNLTLFGLVLAIGIVVDDAIVVVEAVEHHIEHGKGPREASLLAMQQVSGPVVAIGLVLAAVFVPCAFITGIIGQFFRQFALTIAVSTVISAFNSLTLSPALSAILLKHREKGSFESLPWFCWPPIGAWVGHKVGLFWGAHAITALHLNITPEQLEQLKMWGPILGGAVAATLIGVFLSIPLNFLLGWSFRTFNRAFDISTSLYTASVGGLLRVSFLVLLLYGGLLALTWYGFTHTPTGFIPQQDKGYLLVNIQLPDAASVARTREVVARIDDLARFRYVISDETLAALSEQQAPEDLVEHLKGLKGKEFEEADHFLEQLREELNRETDSTKRNELLKSARENRKALLESTARGVEGIRHTVAISGQSILLNANASNFGALYLMLRPFEDRTSRELSGEGIAKTLEAKLQKEVPGAVVNIFGAPPVEGLGTAGGFKIIIEDRTGSAGAAEIQKVADSVVGSGLSRQELQGVFTSFRADTPWLELVVDRAQAADRGVSIDAVRSQLESTLGPFYINDFNRFGRTWQVNVQAMSQYRQTEQDIRQLKVRNVTNEMVPLADFATAKARSGPVLVMRYNMYPSAAIYADAGPETSSGQAIGALEEAAKNELVSGMKTEWTELALLQLQTGNTAMLVFCLAVILVFLVLAAQYESWSLPMAVILVVPMCLLCAIAGVVLAKMDINIFTQIGFLVLVGLACKNAILIVEFAKAQREEGKSGREATLAACQLRLRPIIMTSFAFILGVVPLMVSEGAGAEMRRTLGTAVFSGMLGVTVFGIFLTPVFYFVIQWFAGAPVKREEDDDYLPAPAGRNGDHESPTLPDIGGFDGHDPHPHGVH